MVKVCTRCTTSKSVDQFSPDKRLSSGLRSWCKECARIDGKRYREENKETVRASRLSWVTSNPEKVARINKRHKLKKSEQYVKYRIEYYSDDVNSQKRRDAVKKWMKQNPEKCEGYRRKRHWRKLENWIEDVDHLVVFERDNWVCQLCFEPVDKTLSRPKSMLGPSLDHIIPISKGGEHSYMNTQLAHLLCNCRKSNLGTNND